jgi:hypothetical protein
MATKTYASAAATAMAAPAPMVTNGATTRNTRTTLVIPETLDQNLELYAVKAGLPKGEVIKRVLAEFLTKQGFQPDKHPKSIDVSY